MKGKYSFSCDKMEPTNCESVIVNYANEADIPNLMKGKPLLMVERKKA